MLGGKLKIITPEDPEQRGCQLSLVFNCDLNQVSKRERGENISGNVTNHRRKVDGWI